MFKKDGKKKKKAMDPSRASRNLTIAFLVLVVVLALLTSLTNFITDWMWFIEMGYVSVFFTKLFTQLKFGIPLFIIVTILLNIYLRHLKKGYFKKIVSSENTNLKRLSLITNIISILFGLVVAFRCVVGLWFQILQFTNATDFNLDDPLFGYDISFYIFKLDFLKDCNEILLGIIVLFLVVTVIYYLILLTMRSPDVYEEDEARPMDEETEFRNPFASNASFGNDTPLGKLFDSFGVKMAKWASNPKGVSDSNLKQLLSIAGGKLSILGAVFFIMVGVHFYLKQFNLLHSHMGFVYGAGYTDVNVTLWMYRALIALSVIGAVATAVFIKKKDLKKILIAPVMMICVGVVGTTAGLLVQNYIVSPNEIAKESEYIESNIEYTLYAYDLDNVDVQEFAASDTLTTEDINNNQDTISNIRINDYDPVNTYYIQTQSIRQYYTFNDIDVDRYIINGDYTQTYLAVREIDEDKISDTWLNRHLKYTHGYGITLSRVDTITESGQPDVLIKNIPTESAVEEIEITRPEIYFGELSNEYVIVGTDEEEFDYPDGNTNRYTMYEGDAGIKLNLFNRVLFSIREGSLKLLVSSNIDSESRIIINRNVVERVTTIMPYLSYEGDPYAVTVDGKIYWMLDAYTASSNYPYSEPYDGTEGGINYIRNSVKVVVDAYNGDVDFYIVDEDDPIAKTYQSIYPDLFKDYDEMPEGLQSHIRYPDTLFAIQANIYGRYHMEDINLFYQDEDRWAIAHEIYGQEEQEMEPSYYIVSLPGEDNPEFISILPYTVKSKQNMTALIVARNDGDAYGNLVVYQMPKNKNVYGPMQIEAQIDQNTEISQDFSLWSQAGSEYSRGNLFVIPIEDSLLYVEPIYLESSNTAIPEVKRIIVVYGGQIAYEETLEEALISLFGEDIYLNQDDTGQETDVGDDDTGGTDTEGTQAMTAEDYAQAAADAYDNAQLALTDGNWALYGEYMAQLGEYLEALTE